MEVGQGPNWGCSAKEKPHYYHLVHMSNASVVLLDVLVTEVLLRLLRTLRSCGHLVGYFNIDVEEIILSLLSLF
jgi:hypothetical protein